MNREAPQGQQDPFRFRQATPDEAPQIAELFAAAKHEDLSPEQRAKKGFVQGNLSTQALRDWISADDKGAAVAEPQDRNGIVGVCMYSPAAPGPEDHPVGGLYHAIADSDLATEEVLMFGPLTVAESASGQHLSGRLVSAVEALGVEQGKTAMVSFVDNANEKSIRLHRNLAFDVLAEYTVKNRPFTAFVKRI